MEKIFISYKRADKERVFPIVRRIEKVLKLKCWVDLDGIESSEQFASKICTAIDNAEVVLFMHSSAHLNIDFEKDWTIKELNYAQATGKRVVLVKLDDAPLKNIFLMNYGSTNNIDSNVPEQMEKLFNDLSGWLKLKNAGVGKEKGEEVDAESLYNDGAWALQSGEFSKAVDLFSRAADLGSVDAMYALGYCWENGKGVEVNPVEAERFYIKAALWGHKDAAYGMGYMHEKGCLGAVNMDKAVDWYRKAADKGSVEAMYALGLCYEFGKGVKKDIDKAIEMYRKAVGKGCPHSKIRLEKNGKDIHQL